MKSAAHQYEDKLLEFAYGELPQHEADAVDAHVRGCAKCADALAEIRGVRATMAQLPREPAPDAGLESLLAYAEQTARRNAEGARPAPSLWRRLLMPLASVAALATVGVISLRASEEFDTSPGAVLADKKVEEYEKSERKKLDEAPREAVAAAPAPTPEPVAAAPKDLPAAQAEAGDLAQAQADDRREWGGKRGYVEPQQTKPAPKKVAPASETLRAQKTKSKLQVDNFSNASGAGAFEGLKQEPAKDSVIADKGGGGSFGLGSSTGTGSGPSLGGLSTAPAPRPAEPEAKKRLSNEKAAKEEVAEAPAPAPRRDAPAPSQPSAAPAAPPPPPTTRSSYGLRPLAGSTSSTPSTEDDEAAVQAVENAGLDADAKFAERQRQEQTAQQRSRSLETSRQAAARGDRDGEIAAALEVLRAGATGSQRAEALKRLCDALEAQGQFQRADPYCDQLLSEFPTSSYAQALTQRRNAVQRAAPPTKPATAAPASVDSVKH